MEPNLTNEERLARELDYLFKVHCNDGSYIPTSEIPAFKMHIYKYILHRERLACIDTELRIYDKIYKEHVKDMPKYKELQEERNKLTKDGTQ